MNLKHRIRINVTRPDGNLEAVLNGGSKSIRSKLLEHLLGKELGVLVITPGDSVQTIEIHEMKET